MKKIFFTIIVVTSSFFSEISSADSCLDFSGRYLLQDENTKLTTALEINQNQCQQLEANYIFNQSMNISRHLYLDNQKHLAFSSSDMTSEETSTISQNEIIIDTLDSYTIEKQKYLSHTVMTLDNQKNLIEVIQHFKADGSLHSTETNKYIRHQN